MSKMCCASFLLFLWFVYVAASIWRTTSDAAEVLYIPLSICACIAAVLAAAVSSLGLGSTDPVEHKPLTVHHSSQHGHQFDGIGAALAGKLDRISSARDMEEEEERALGEKGPKRRPESQNMAFVGGAQLLKVPSDSPQLIGKTGGVSQPIGGETAVGEAVGGYAAAGMEIEDPTESLEARSDPVKQVSASFGKDAKKRQSKDKDRSKKQKEVMETE